MFLISFQLSSSQEVRAQIICAGLLDPTPDISKAITEAEATDTGRYSQNIHTLFKSSRALYFRFPNTQISFNVLHLFTDMDKQPVDNLSKVAPIDIDSFLSQTSKIRKGVIYNIC